MCMHAADNTENAKKNMPWQGEQKFSDPRIKIFRKFSEIFCPMWGRANFI